MYKVKLLNIYAKRGIMLEKLKNEKLSKIEKEIIEYYMNSTEAGYVITDIFLKAAFKKALMKLRLKGIVYIGISSEGVIMFLNPYVFNKVEVDDTLQAMFRHTKWSQ